MLEPPQDEKPERLFRRLLTLPRPWVDIDYRLRGAEDVRLRVQAVTASELAGTGPEVVAAALLVGRQPAFRDAESVRHALSPPDLERLLEAVAEALDLCSPVDGRSQWKAWQDQLLIGCRHVTNHRDAYALGSHLEVVGRRVMPRPERFFGVPPSVLVDAHWFAYRAALSYFVECQKDK